MSVYTQLDELTAAHDNIAAAIVAKGVAAAATHGFVDFASDISSIPTGSTADYYKISFNTDGGSAIDDIYKTDGVDITLPSKTPIKELYIFDKWNTSADGTGTAYAPGDTFSVDSDTTLYAQYQSMSELYVFEEFIKTPGDNTAATIIEYPRSMNTKISMSYMVTESLTGKARCLLGATRDSTANLETRFRDCCSFRYAFYQTDREFNSCYGNTSAQKCGSVSYNVVRTAVCGWSTVTLDGTDYTQSRSAYQLQPTMTKIGVCGQYGYFNEGFTEKGPFAIYSLDFSEEVDGVDEIKAKYRPATRTEDGKVGLVDILSGDFVSSVVSGQEFVTS